MTDIIYDTFDAMGLPDPLIRGIYGYGFERPSMIQQLAIVPMSGSTDILAQAQSGPGRPRQAQAGPGTAWQAGRQVPQMDSLRHAP